MPQARLIDKTSPAAKQVVGRILQTKECAAALPDQTAVKMKFVAPFSCT